MWGKRLLASSQARGSARLTLVALGEAADKNGLVSASVPDLARWTQTRERQLRYDLRELEKIGEIKLLAAGGGRGNPAQYRITVQWRGKFWLGKAIRKGGNQRKGLAGLNGAYTAPFI